jgi:hypothetical protein
VKIAKIDVEAYSAVPAKKRQVDNPWDAFKKKSTNIPIATQTMINNMLANINQPFQRRSDQRFAQ